MNKQVMQKDTYIRARYKIMNHICQFSLSKKYGGKQVFGGLFEYAFNGSNLMGGESPEIGTLVAMDCVGPSKWYLSWLIKIESINSGSRKYLLQSIEDHDTAWWENVGIQHLDLSVVLDNEDWKWTDDQYRFSDEWSKICIDNCGTSLVLPGLLVFNADGSVSLSLREKFDGELSGNKGWNPSKSFVDYRKVSTKEIVDFINDSISKRNKIIENLKANEQEQSKP